MGPFVESSDVGCDIHAYLERRVDGRWEFYVDPDRKFNDYGWESNWYDELVDARLDSEAAFLLAGTTDRDVARAVAIKYFSEMSLEEGLAKYADDENLSLYPLIDSRLTNRNYSKFAFLSGVRSSNDEENVLKLDERGFPDDASTHVRTVFRRWDGDAHTPGWFMVRELVPHKNKMSAVYMEDFYKYLTSLPDFEEVRVVFFYDN